MEPNSIETPVMLSPTADPYLICSKTPQKAGSFVAGAAPIPIALAKKALQNYARLDLIQALDHEQIAQEICRKTEDRVEGMKSFVEKREPVFKGK